MKIIVIILTKFGSMFPVQLKGPARFLTQYSYIGTWCSMCFIISLSPLS